MTICNLVCWPNTIWAFISTNIHHQQDFIHFLYNCSQKLLPHILCAQNANFSFQQTKSQVNFESVKAVQSCFHTDIVVNSTCFQFVWFSILPRSEWKRHASKQFGKSAENLAQMKKVKEIFRATTAEIPVLLTTHGLHNNLVISLKCQCEQHFIECFESEKLKPGFFVFTTQKKRLEAGVNLHHCDNEEYISAAKRCDTYIDCAVDQSDEKNCPLELTKQLHNNFLSQLETSCGLLFYRAADNKCYPHVREFQKMTRKSVVSNQLCSCPNGVALECTLNDLFVDCPLTYFDEPELLTLLQGRTQLCAVLGQLQCLKGHSKCFNITDI